MNGYINLRSLTFSILFFFLLLQEFVSKLIDIDDGVYLKLIDEFTVFVMAVISLVVYLDNNSGIQSNLLARIARYFLLYVVLSFISSFLGYSTLLSAFYQFALDAKFFIVLFFCIVMSSSWVNYNTIFRIMSVVMLLNLPFVFFQLVLPTMYDSFFPEGNHKALFYSSSGDGYTRVSGIFWHPGTMATMCALTIGLIVTKKHYNLSLSLQEKIILTISAVQILFTLSRGEIGALLFSLFMVKFMIRRDFVTSFVYFIIPGVMVLIALIMFNEFFDMMIAELGLSSTAAELAPRAQLLVTSLEIVKDYFPLGAGLGTYGGQSSIVFDSAVYWKYGFSDFWWYEEGFYLKDTFWPKVLGESGFAGTICLLLFIISIINIAKNKAISQLDHQSCFSFFASVYLFVVSFSAPVYNTPVYTVIAFSLLGFVFCNMEVDY